MDNMERKHLYTAVIGIMGALLFREAARSILPDTWRVVLCVAGAVTFLWAAGSLFMEWRGRLRNGWSDSLVTGRSRVPGERATRLELLSEEGTVVYTWELYQKVSAVIGRDSKENMVDIDLGRSDYASMVDIHHAVLNYAEGSWYVEDLGSHNGVAVQKLTDGRKYRISPGCPCKLQTGDIIVVGMSRLRLN